LTDELRAQQKHELEIRKSTSIQGVPVEFIVDSDLVAFHTPEEAMVDVFPTTATDVHLLAYRGPFGWFGFKFPEITTAKFKDSTPVVADGVHEGWATKTVLFTKPGKVSEGTLLIAFDPSIGFLPRYARLLVDYKNGDGSASVREFWLLQTRQCSAGGFVPVEWVETFFRVKDFRERYRNLTPEAPIENPSDEVEFVHFGVTNFEDGTSEPALNCEKGFKGIVTSGGLNPIPSTPKQLTMRDVKTILGMTPTFAPSVPRIAVAELNEFQHTQHSKWRFLLAAALILIGGGFTWIAYRRIRAIIGVIVLTSLSMTGCSKPLPALETRFENPTLLFENDSPDVLVPLLVRNSGNCDVLVKGIEGSCTCSVVDVDLFPKSLMRGEEMEVLVRLKKRYDFATQQMAWTIRTNGPNIQCKSSIYMFPRAKISPFSRNFPSLVLDKAQSFELVVQRIWRDSEPEPNDSLPIGDRVTLTAKQTRTGGGPVAGFQFEEITYDVAINDQTTMGPNKEVIQLRDDSGRAIASAQVLWNRVPHVSTVPERVYLAHNKVRVFLRSTEDCVEFIGVNEAPEGVEAIVTSPREITVRPRPGAPNSITGEVVVQTNSGDSPTIKIPIVRHVIAQERQTSDRSDEAPSLP
jgi:hypothetical protein